MIFLGFKHFFELGVLDRNVCTFFLTPSIPKSQKRQNWSYDISLLNQSSIIYSLKSNFKVSIPIEKTLLYIWLYSRQEIVLRSETFYIGEI